MKSILLTLLLTFSSAVFAAETKWSYDRLDEVVDGHNQTRFILGALENGGTDDEAYMSYELYVWPTIGKWVFASRIGDKEAFSRTAILYWTNEETTEYYNGVSSTVNLFEGTNGFTYAEFIMKNESWDKFINSKYVTVVFNSRTIMVDMNARQPALDQFIEAITNAGYGEVFTAD